MSSKQAMSPVCDNCPRRAKVSKTDELPRVALTEQELFDAWLKRYKEKNNVMTDARAKPRRTDIVIEIKRRNPKKKPRKIRVKQKRYHSRKAVTKLLKLKAGHQIAPVPRFVINKVVPAVTGKQIPLLLLGPVTQRKGRRHRKLRELFEEVIKRNLYKVGRLSARMSKVLIGQAVEAGVPFEINKIADEVAYNVICKVFGLDEMRREEHRKLFFRWLDDMMKVKGPFELFSYDETEIYGFFNNIIDARLKLNLDEPIDKMLRAKGMTRRELVGQLVFDFISATVTSTHAACSAIIGAVYIRSHDPEKYARIMSRIDGTNRTEKYKALDWLYQEALRFAGPSRLRPLFNWWWRFIDGTIVWPTWLTGIMPEVCFASANRDPDFCKDEFGDPNPHVFDPERKPDHIAFGIAEPGKEAYACPGEQYSGNMSIALLLGYFALVRDWDISLAEFRGEMIMRAIVVVTPPVRQ